MRTFSAACDAVAKRALYAVALVTAGLTVFAPSASAASKALEEAKKQSKTAAGDAGLKVDESANVWTMISGMINVVLGLTGVILLILIIYAGFLWMTAGGNEEQVTKAKTILKNAVIGMVLLFASYAIALFVTAAATGEDTTELIVN